MQIIVPVLESARLRLRGHRPEDLDDCAALWGDPEVTRHIGGRSLTREEVWARLLRYAGSWFWLGYGYWVVEEKCTQQFVGEVGYANLQREVRPPVGDPPELGWVLARPFHGKGYATEAVRAAISWGDQKMGFGQSFCMIDPDHARSIRVAEKCDFKESHQADYKGEPVIVFRRETLT
jgi:RimJ/RimL family protein N-acetyltransferase